MGIKNTAELREMLLKSIDLVQNGTMDPRQAQAVSALSGKVLQSAKLDLEVVKFNHLNEGAIKAGEKVLQLVNEK